MILFNLIFFRDTVRSLGGFSTDFSHEATSIKKSYNLTKKQNTLAYVVKSHNILSEPKQKLAQKKFIRQNFSQKLVNNLWREEIYLSINSKLFSKYNVELNALSINKHKNTYKYLLSKFSRSLFDMSIQSSLTTGVKHAKSFSSIQYIWGKALNLHFLSVNKLIGNYRTQNNIQAIRSTLNEKIYLNHVPLFTISNHLGQMIISEPPVEFNSLNNVDSDVEASDHNSNMYQGYFFVNYQDAQEYRQYIQKYYNLDNGNLKIFTCNFNTFYKIMDRFNRVIYFRLVPDLEEVSNLIKRYKQYRHVSFYKKQNYGRTYFQGQPLYFVKNDQSYVSYNLFQKQQKSEYNLAFTNYNEALYMYNKLKNQKSGSQYLKKPYIVVYNLEHFIKDQINSKNNFENPFFLVPSQKSYLFTKQFQLKGSRDLVYDTFSQTVSYIKLWSKRVLWSLTSKKP